MSLHALANDMASKGRHGDSMLVHMSPNEVAGLHALALHHGEKLTINPDTGLPEAFKLKSLLPLVLGAALGPAGLGLSSMMAAGVVGAGYGLAKGSLKEGLMAGLGAYGGAGLAASLGSAGVSEAAAQEAFKQSGTAAANPLSGMEAAALENPAVATSSTTGVAGSPTAGAETVSPVAQVVIDPVTTTTPMTAATTAAEQAAVSGFTPPTGLEALKQGAQSIYDKGTFGDFAKANKNYLYSAGASAMLSPEDEEGMPETKRDPGYIRPARYDWRTGKYEYFEPVKASEWGTRNLSEYTNANDPNARTPIGRKAGGLMALANGGAIAFDDGGFVVGGGRTSPEEIQRLTAIKAKEDADAAAKLAAYTPSDPILAPMLAAGVKGMLHGETDEQAYNRIKQMDMDRTERMARRDALRAQMGPDDVAIDGQIVRTTTPGPTTPGPTTPGPTTPGPTTPGPTTPPPVYTPPPGPYNPPPPMPNTPGIDAVTTGGSRDAYKYLFGQGAYPTDPYLPINPLTGTRDVARPIYDTPGYAALKPKPSASLYSSDPNKKPTGNPGTGNEWVWKEDQKKWVSQKIGASGSTTTPEPVVEPTSGATGGLMPRRMALGGLGALAGGGSASRYNLGDYSDGGRLLKGPGDGVSDNIPATIGGKQPARLADGEFVVPARIVSELGNGSTDAGARKLYAMMDRVQKARGKTTGKKRVAVNSRSDKYLPA
jgi:hypothetical protein